MSLAVMGPAEVAILETFVVPRFLNLFGEAALATVLAGEAAAVAHLGCRTGYPDRELVGHLQNCSLVGVERSPAALELARNKAATLPGAAIAYCLADSYPTPLHTASFSHALSLYPEGNQAARLDLFAEMGRLLYSGGQAILSLPLRGSFVELHDLLGEFCLKNDAADLQARLEQAAQMRPNEESLTLELEEIGFNDVHVTRVRHQVTFGGGRAFIEDPTTRLLIVPDLLVAAGLESLTDELAYVREAIDKYWSESEFSLTVNVGVVSARRP